MTMNNKLIGVSDQPRSPGENDLLNTDAYAQGLCEFIANCTTHMSIAVQGDWGTGKTSILKQIEKDMGERGIKTVLVNTWMYSQMRLGENLSSIFVKSLLEGMGHSKSEDVRKLVLGGIKIIGQIVLQAVGMDGDTAADVVALADGGECSDIFLVKELRKNFQTLVKKEIEAHRKDAEKKGGGQGRRARAC